MSKSFWAQIHIPATQIAPETLRAVADAGYYNGGALKECEEGGIVAYVPEPKRTGVLEGKGRFTHEEFSFNIFPSVNGGDFSESLGGGPSS